MAMPPIIMHSEHGKVQGGMLNRLRLEKKKEHLSYSLAREGTKISSFSVYLLKRRHVKGASDLVFHDRIPHLKRKFEAIDPRRGALFKLAAALILTSPTPHQP